MKNLSFHAIIVPRAPTGARRRLFGAAGPFDWPWIGRYAGLDLQEGRNGGHTQKRTSQLQRVFHDKFPV